MKKMMQLVEQHKIKPTHPSYKELRQTCRLSKNLYNAGNYKIRQSFITKDRETPGVFINYYTLVKLMAEENNPDFRALPAKVSQATLKRLSNNWKSFFSLRRNGHKSAKMPKYLPKDGYNAVEYTKQAISKKGIKRGFLELSGVDNFSLKLIRVNLENYQAARIIPKKDYIIIEIIYLVEAKEHVPSERFASVDLGIDNLMTIVSTEFDPLIISGKPLKSINQYYNKKLAKLRSASPKKTTNRIKRLHEKRNNKVKDYLHKASRLLINQLVSTGVTELVIGHNKNWKQEINIGKVNNQKFVQIPHSRLIELLTYKAELAGIKVYVCEESYTSKCSFLDREPITKRETYLGKRTYRGLFKSSDGTLINADVNGAANILTKYLKVVGKTFKVDSIEVSSSPLKLEITL